MLLDEANTHTPTVYLCANSIFCYRELHFGLDGLTLAMLSSYTRCCFGLVCLPLTVAGASRAVVCIVCVSLCPVHTGGYTQCFCVLCCVLG